MLTPQVIAPLHTCVKGIKGYKNLEIPYLYPVRMSFSARDEQISFNLKNYGRSPAIISDTDVGVIIHPANNFHTIMFDKRKRFMVDGFIGPGETSESMFFSDAALSQHGANIELGVTTLALRVSTTHQSVTGMRHDSHKWFVWNWRRNKFVAGRQLHGEVEI